MVITIYQQDIVWQQPSANRRRVEEALATAPTSDIFLLPETFTTGFGADMATIAEPADGPTLQWARLQAAHYNLLIAATWVVREGDACYNRMHWVKPDGTWGHYDKAHLFRPSSEARELTAGTEHPTFEWRGWRIRPAVCYDLRFPTWLRNKGLDYDLLLLSANWPTGRRMAWSTLLRARAIENLCYVAGCNRAGTDDSNTLYTGDSAIIDFKGNTLQEAIGEQLITATLDRESLDRFRQKWPFHLDFD